MTTTITERVEAIINSEHFHYLFGRWQDESEYEDFAEYRQSIESVFKVKVLEAKEDPFEFTIQFDDGEKWLINCIERDDYTVGRARRV